MRIVLLRFYVPDLLAKSNINSNCLVKMNLLRMLFNELVVKHNLNITFS